MARSSEPLASSVSRSLRLTRDVVIDIPGAASRVSRRSKGGRIRFSSVFPERQVKVAARVFGIEIVTLAEIHFQDLQRLPHLVDHVAREWRRHHMRPPANEQRILQEVAQSFQRMADRGLGEVQLLAGTSNIALAIDGFQHHEAGSGPPGLNARRIYYRIRKIH